MNEYAAYVVSITKLNIIFKQDGRKSAPNYGFVIFII